jgi:hypothetical protein
MGVGFVTATRGPLFFFVDHHAARVSPSGRTDALNRAFPFQQAVRTTGLGVLLNSCLNELPIRTTAQEL